MIVGERTSFAIESELVERTGRWLLGHFRIWASGRAIGDFGDLVDLGGCRSWLADLGSVVVNREEPELGVLDAETVFYVVYRQATGDAGALDSVGVGSAFGILSEPFRRFFISHVGMSAFDDVDLLLFHVPGRERLIWRDAKDGQVREAYVPAGMVEGIARLYCDDWDKSINVAR